MLIAENGFFPWLFWALFDWRGKIKRLPYLGALSFMVVFGFLYTVGLCLLYARAAGPLPEDTFASADNLLALLVRYEPPLYTLLPLTCINIILDVKRLRSIGLTVYLAVGISLLNLARPVEPSLTALICLLVAIAYLLILLFAPEQAVTKSGSGTGRGSGWVSAQARAEATAEGGPRRLRGAHVKSWRILAPAPQEHKTYGEN